METEEVGGVWREAAWGDAAWGKRLGKQESRNRRALDGGIDGRSWMKAGRGEGWKEDESKHGGCKEDGFKRVRGGYLGFSRGGTAGAWEND